MALQLASCRPTACRVGMTARRAGVSSTRSARSFICRAEAPQPVETAPQPVEAAQSVPETPAAAEPSPVAAAVPGFMDVFAFGGVAPELLNGRLAMLGFTAALGAELASGKDVAQQLAGGMPIIVAWISMLIIGGSLAPIFKGAKMEPFFFFTPEAEKFNGRAAMIGFAALLAVEAVKGSALF